MRITLFRLATLGFLVLLVAPIAVQSQDHEHDHEAMHSSGELDPQRSDEGKWASDASLRQGMNKLKEAFEPAHGAYRNDRFDSEQATDLADDVEEAVNFMFANCQLPGDADAELHKLLAAALGAAESLRGSDAPHEGLHQLHRVLEAYPEFFDHPGWTR
ncbi:hypothetical protein [Wenzhouxiangella sp. EGI_FJ10305]|uniref:hypothetical protein n=1 Tax=Wenzhouxiangella sp. EGI_FJ10305 TaxID=3243768 RepID=UPI0035DCB924